MAHQKSSDPNVFILPDLGEGVHEAELIKWRVSVGETVEEHQVIADMETDKALVEVPSPRAGTIAQLHGQEGETLHVGNPLVSYVPGAGAGAASAAAGAEACDMGAQIAGNVPTSNGRHAAPADLEAPVAERTEDAGTVVGSMGGALGGVSAAPGKALATPAVRRLARDLGVDIDAVAGSGLAGRVTERDVRGAASGGAARRVGTAAAAAAAPALSRTSPNPVVPTDPEQPHSELVDALPARSGAAPGGAARPSAASAPAPRAAPAMPAGADTQRVPVRGVRRTIANRLRESISQTVHFTVMDEADVTALDALRRKLAAASGEKLSFLPFVASAVCRCLAGEFAQFNSTTDDKAEEIVRHRAVHLGIATDTENGLMVPVLRDCDALGVLEIGRRIGQTAQAARDRTAPREALMGSTFTISNVGSHAGRFATPIINYPEVGILAVGRARPGVVVRQGMIGVGTLLPLSLACDHRVVDGAGAALMLARLIELLQSPEQLLEPARR